MENRAIMPVAAELQALEVEEENAVEPSLIVVEINAR